MRVKPNPHPPRFTFPLVRRPSFVAGLIGITAAAACSDEEVLGPAGETGPFPKAGVFEIAAAGETDDGGSADDPAIWIHPTDPSLSLIIGADKSRGLRVYSLDGTQLQFVEDGDHNNVDVRYGFMLGGRSVDLVSVSNRSTDRIDVYTVDPDARTLSKVGSIATGITVYGYAMYHSRSTGRYFGFVSSKSGEIEQYEFSDQAGTVDGELVRTLDLDEQVEGMVADDELGWFYAGQEDGALWKLGAEPEDGTAATMVDQVGSSGHLTADIEGLTLYYRGGGLGYLVVSSQGASRFDVFRREGDNEYLASFTVSLGSSDPVTSTDGIDVTNLNLGSTSSSGLFVVHDDTGDNYKLVPWGVIADAIGLAIDTRGYDERGGSTAPVAPSGDFIRSAVDYDLVWDVIDAKIPTLKQEIERILKD